MKNVLKAFGIIAIIAVIGFSMAACGGDGEETPPISAFAGIWNASNGRSIYIIGDWFEYKVITDKTYDGTFSVSGSKITFNATGKGAASGKYTLSGDTLTLSNHTWDTAVNGTYTKVGDGGDTVLATMTFEDTGNWNEDETYPRWRADYQDADKSFDLATMYAQNKAYFITYSFSSDIDIDELAFEFNEYYDDGTWHWVHNSDWARITLDIIKKDTKYNGSIFALPNADAVGTQAARTYLRLYVKNRNVTTGANMTFYQLKFEVVEIATLNSVTANGDASSTTTQLTLALSKAITGLSADDITLSGVDGVTKGTLSGSGTTYTLPISGFTKGGTLNIALEKSGYVFKNWLKTATIYYKSGSSGGGDNEGTFNSLDDFKNWLNGKGNNSKGNPFKIKLNLPSLSGLLDFLKGSLGKFLSLDLSTSTFTGIGADAFKGLSNLTDLTLPSTVTGSIGANAFDGCSNLTNISLPSGITGIGAGAFNGCTSLTDITLPSGITSIGANAFDGCTNLTNITLPSGINSIGASAFNGCTNLISVTFNGTITSGNFSSTTPFPGDLRDKYLAGGAGTYTRTSGGTTWTKQGGGGTDIASFAGTWNASGNRSIVFSGSTFTYKVNGTTTYSGIFSVSGSTITFNATGLGTASGGFSLSGTTLTLSNHTWDSSVNGTYTKDGGSSGGGDTADVYVVGEDYADYHSIAAYWKNGVKQILNNNSSSAKSVFVSGNDVYVVGTVNGDSGSRATLWKNGTAQTLSSSVSNASSVFVSGSDVYVVGQVSTGTSNQATLWKNGTAQTLSTSTAYPYSVYVSGSDVYVAGYAYIGSSTNENARATLWKNGTAQTLGSSTSVAYSVYVSGSDVYVAGVVGSGGTDAKATLWKNGIAQTLSDEFSSANSVYVSGTDVYVGGGSNSTTPLYPAIWKNGTVQKLNTRSGQANSVFVSGTDVYAVGSRSGPTLWKNGVEQTLDANTTNNTTAQSIFVVPKN